MSMVCWWNIPGDAHGDVCFHKDVRYDLTLSPIPILKQLNWNNYWRFYHEVGKSSKVLVDVSRKANRNLAMTVCILLYLCAHDFSAYK